MIGLVIFSLISGQPLPTDGPEEARVESIQDPVILWEEGPLITWTRGRDDDRDRIAPVIMTLLMPPDMSVGESLVASIDVGARLILMSNKFEFNIFAGPQSVRFARQSATTVGVTRVAVPEGLGPGQTDLETVVGSPRWTAGALALRLLNETPAQQALQEPGKLQITWPNTRALRPPQQNGCPVATWRHGDSPDASPCNIEVEELNSNGEPIRLQERWTGIRTESLKLRAPWSPGRRYRLTVADSQTRTSTETRVLSEDAVAEVDRSLEEVQALHGTLGAAAIALETLILKTAELDAEARIRWWHLAMVTLAYGNGSRAAEFFARAGPTWP